MREDLFGIEINAAFDDIVATAPTPPRLDRITAGFARLQAPSPRPWYQSGAAAFVGAAAAVVLIVGVAIVVAKGAGSNTYTLSTAPVDQTIDNLYGVWVLDNYTADGVTHDAPFNADRPTPWIQFLPEHVVGFAGCNDFGSSQPPRIEEGRLVLGEVWAEAAGCEDMRGEQALLGALWAGPEGPEIEISATTLQLTAPDVVLVLAKSDRIPIGPLRGWGLENTDLACADGVVVEHRLRDPSATVTAMLKAVPGVVRVEERSEFKHSLGFDANDVPIASVIAGDVEPRQYHRQSCAVQWSLRPGADLGGAVATWVNDLGLNQRATDVWSDRFVEVCAADEADLSGLAARYVTDDTTLTLRADSSLPTVGQAASTLATISRMVCLAPG